MFSTTAFQVSSPRRLAGAYSAVGIETQVLGANPHKLVCMLFDGFMESIAQAKGAIRNGDVAMKGRAIGRACRIVEEGLKAGLDTQSGGALASDLRDLYAYVAMRLLQANLRNDEAALDECRNLIAPLRDAWSEIGDRV